MNKTKPVSFLLIFFLFFSSTMPIDAQTDANKMSETLENLFLPFFENAIRNDGSISRDLSNQNDPLSTGFSAGLSIVTLMKLYDLYNQSIFLNHAQVTSDYISTSLDDPRYPLFASYYDASSGISSNYRSIIDNFLFAWGLSDLRNRIDPDDIQAVFEENERANAVINDIDLFDNDIGFKEQIRVDQDINSQNFNVFINLFAAYIITESSSSIFNLYEDKPIEIFNFVEENATDPDGGVHTIIFNGYSDELVTLRNTALYANLAMNLYSETSDNKYLDIANSTMNYIQSKFYDIGVTGGYFETLVDGVPIQQSKSLFSHALLLQLLLKLANTGDETAKIYLIALWRTISQYFREGNLFFSTLNRAGEPSSSTINTVDNLMMLYSTRSLPLIANLAFKEEIEFVDQLKFSLLLQVPLKVNTELSIILEGEVLENVVIDGQNSLVNQEIVLDPIRPNNDEETFTYRIELKTQGVLTDFVEFDVTISLRPGINLSIGVITVFSVIAVIIFVLFIKRYEEPSMQ